MPENSLHHMHRAILPIQLRATSGVDQRFFHARLIRAGHTRNVLNEKTDMLVTAEALQQAVNDGLFDGLACFIDHSIQPSLRNLIGNWHFADYLPDEEAVNATLKTFRTSSNAPVIELLEQVIELQANGDTPPDIGVSLV
ncbi:MAG: hypothetical protein R3293_24810, partial [Candidatus Promineifilaceae bacterium]|nr:hypothetical protein [Candidatus Promineifilaceae bacterium]